MQAMVKGTEVEHMSRILHDSTAAGIWNHTFFFFGFPGETIEDAQATVNFLYAHKDAYSFGGIGHVLNGTLLPCPSLSGALWRQTHR